MERSTVSRRGLLGFSSAALAAAAMPRLAFAAVRAPDLPKLFYTDVGAGRNVMLLHGWTADSHDWSYQLPLLESRYRTMAVDLRGYGRSDVPPSGAYTPDDYVADIEALAANKAGGKKFVLVGHSMGGQIAARLAAKRPDLIDAVVSIDGSLGFADDLTPVFQKATADLLAGNPGQVAAALFELFYDPATPAPLKRWHARRAQGTPAHVVRESFGPLFLGSDQVGVGAQSERFLRQVKLPIYHLCRDPKQAERMRPWFSNPRSQIDVWDKAGHWIMQDRPDDVNAALVAWIDRH